VSDLNDASTALAGRVRAALPRLKVFPLPPAVLFPGVSMPLHIFEPRYRALVRDALATDGVFALAGLEDGWEGDSTGRPPLRTVACAGVITWHEGLPQGRFNLLLEGQLRVRIVAEHPQQGPYREVAAEALESAEAPAPAEEAAVRQGLLELATLLPRDAAEVLVREGARARGGALADVVAAAVVADAERRRELLEQLSPRVRLQEVMGDLSEVLAQLRTRTGPEGLPN
jgi:Lon protease-like protein